MRLVSAFRGRCRRLSARSPRVSTPDQPSLQREAPDRIPSGSCRIQTSPCSRPWPDRPPLPLAPALRGSSRSWGWEPEAERAVEPNCSLQCDCPRPLTPVSASKRPHFPPRELTRFAVHASDVPNVTAIHMPTEGWPAPPRQARVRQPPLLSDSSPNLPGHGVQNDWETTSNSDNLDI